MADMTVDTAVTARRHQTSRASKFKSQIALQSMILPGLLVFLVFEYGPMFGLQIAFRDYTLVSGFFDAPWVGFRHFQRLLVDPNLWTIVRNTLGINVLGLILGFPAPLLFALFLTELRNQKFKKFTQTVSYLPHFVSWVVFGGLVINLLSPSTGAINRVLMNLGLIDDAIFFMGRPDYFWFIAVLSGILKGFGWGAILYLAAMAGVDPQLYEAAIVDGAGRFKRMWHITLPCIMGTTVILLIFAISGMLSNGFEQIWVLQNSLNVSRSEVIDTYVYKVGLQQMRFSFATAVGFLRSILAVMLVVGANTLSTRITEKGLF
ncbi:MAG: sugar ABC transporter permease [Spirochaetaceae bacterium]|nr:MAG: sugar ABC transporter permease [Spirochaetaceae bacterium]